MLHFSFNNEVFVLEIEIKRAIKKNIPAIGSAEARKNEPK